MTAVARSARWRETLRSSGVLVGLVALIVLFGALRPQSFLTASNFTNVLDQVAILAVIGIAQSVIMVVGDFDLSVGATASLAGIVSASLLLADVPVPIAVAAGIALGALVGLVNGALVVGFQLSAFVVTLATMTSAVGISFTVTNGGTLYGLPEAFTWIGQERIGGIPVLGAIVVVVAVLVLIVLRLSVLGRKWYAIGGSAEVAKLSGINVGGLRIAAFTLGGAIAALGGVLLTSRLGSVTPVSGDSYTLLSVAAVFLGMTLSRQGVANIGGTLIGVGLLGILANGLNIVGVGAFVQQILTGVIIIVSVTISRLSRRAQR